MEEIQRYEMILTTRCGEGWQELQREPEGEWVRYEDHENYFNPLHEALEAMLERFTPFIETRGDEAVIDRAKVALAKVNGATVRQPRTIESVADALRLLNDFDKLEAKYADLQAVLDEKERFINAQEEELDEKDERIAKATQQLQSQQGEIENHEFFERKIFEALGGSVGKPPWDKIADLRAKCDRMTGLLKEFQRNNFGHGTKCIRHSSHGECQGFDERCDLCKRTDSEVGQ